MFAVGFLVHAPDAAAFTCPRNPLSPFQLAERAEEIAIVDGTPEGVRVERVLLGTGRPWADLPVGERAAPGAAPPPAPPPPTKTGRRRRVIVLDGPRCRWDSLSDDVQGRVLAFATAEGWAAHPFGTSVVALPPGSTATPEEERDLIDALAWWLEHPDRRARRRRLLGLARRPDRLGIWAALHFRAAPELLHDMSRAERVELAIAIGRMLRRVEAVDGGPLLEALARLHVPEALPATFDLAESPRVAAYRDFFPVHQAVGLLVGRDVWTPLGEHGDRATWMSWLAANGASTREALLRASFVALGLGSIDPEDPRALATIVREGPSREVRLLALDLCEQRIGRMLRLDEPPSRLWDYSGVGSVYLDGDPQEHVAATWPALATRCAEGAP